MKVIKGVRPDLTYLNWEKRNIVAKVLNKIQGNKFKVKWDLEATFVFGRIKR